MPTLATEKQVNFIRKLAEERGILDEADAFLNLGPDKKQASTYIGTLLDMAKPIQEKPADGPVDGIDLRPVPSGYYAAEDEEGVLRFFKIDNVEKGRWEGWIFVKVMASDELYRQGMQRPGQAYSGKSQHAVSLIAQEPQEASSRYGHEIGVCGVCGRTLTDPESIERGIGPVCAQKF